jgi:hypothetical protein
LCIPPYHSILDYENKDIYLFNKKKKK